MGRLIADVKDTTKAIKKMIEILYKLNPDRSAILEVRLLRPRRYFWRKATALEPIACGKEHACPRHARPQF